MKTIQKLLLLLLISSICLFFFCTKEALLPLSKTMRTNLALLPQNSFGFGYANFSSLKESAFFEDFIKSWEKDSMFSEDLAGIIEKTGFDFRKDVEEIYFSLSEDSQVSRHPGGLLVVNGKFDQEKILKFLKEENPSEFLESIPFKDYQLYRIRDKKIAFCFPQKDKFLAGAENEIKTCIERMETNPKISPEMFNRVKNLKYKDDAWLSCTVQPIIKQFVSEFHQNNELNQIKGIRSIEEMNLSFNFGSKIQLNGRGNFNNKEDSKLFLDVLKGVIATAKLSLSKDRTAVDVLNKIHLESRDNSIELNFTFTKDDINKLKESKEKFLVI